MKWISVNKKKPRNHAPVIVFCPDGIGSKVLIGSYWTNKTGGYSHWTTMDGDFQEKDRTVTHWMPLPPKP